MRLKDLLAFDQGVAIIMKEKVDFRLAYRLTKIVKKIQSEVEAFNVGQKALFEKYGKQDKDGQMIIDKKNMEKFTKDVEELSNQEVEVDFEPVPLELLEKQEKIETEVLIKMYLFIEEPKEEPKPDKSVDKSEEEGDKEKQCQPKQK